MNNDEQMRAAFEAWNRETGRTSIDHELLDCWESAWQAATAAAQAGVPEESDGAEEWMPLAWALCAEENGEDACNELLWSGGPIPEPWGDRWLTYEDEAKRMIALVRKHLAAAPSPQGDLRDERFGPVAMILRDICELDADDPEDPNTICINVETLERIVRKYIPAAPSPPAAEPWQPIETAPAGVRIDVYAGGRISDAIQLEAGQWHRAFNGAYHAIWPLPTHWMHLPQPPTTGDSNAAV